MDDLAEMGRELETKNGVLVYFNTISWRWYLPSEEELKTKLDLRLVVREQDGSIYRKKNLRSELVRAAPE